MPIWLIVVIILILLSLVFSLFEWIGDHIVVISITLIALALLFFLRNYLIIVIPVLLGVGVLFGIGLSIYSRIHRTKIQTKLNNKKKDYVEEVESLNLGDDTEKVLIKGYSYIEALKEYNARIPNEEMSRQIDSLEATTKKIFDEVKQHPEKIGKLQRLMDYYLPTVDGILSRYAQYDANSITGENVNTSKQKIKETMGTINEGFNNILNDLYSGDKMDISSDLVVLKQMLERDGLLDNDE